MIFLFQNNKSDRMRLIKCFLILIIIGVYSFPAFSQNEGIPAKPNPPRLVNDYTGVLSVQEINQLEQKLVNYNKETSNQIVVVFVDDMHGYDVSDFAYQIGENWKVGQEKFDNGVVVLVKPKGSAGSRKAFIAVGYGLEGVIPDIAAKRIVDNEMIPHFKTNDFFGGINKATDVIMALASKEYSYNDYKKKGMNNFWTLGIFGFILLIFYLLSRKFKGGKGSNSGNVSHGGFYPLFGPWTTMSSGRSSGGFGGGGFGGFGGGSFGGGGAGGSW